jgi:hypothetical protein
MTLKQTIIHKLLRRKLKIEQHEPQGLVTIQVNILSMYKHIQGRTSFLPPLASSRVCFLNSFYQSYQETLKLSFIVCTSKKMSVFTSNRPAILMMFEFLYGQQLDIKQPKQRS